MTTHTDAQVQGVRVQDGGLWINLGPLLYHWADAHTYLAGEELSIELPLEDVERIAATLGFTTLQRQMVTAGFNTDARCACRFLSVGWQLSWNQLSYCSSV